MPTLDRHTVLERLRSVLERHPVRFGLLYGSYAAGRPTPVSDIDVAVYADRPEELLDVVVALEEAFSGHRVDVMNLKDKPALVYYEVLASGVPVLVRDPSFLEAETYRVMREYLDFQPIHERIRAVGLCNLLVHEYLDVDDALVFAALERLDDLAAFAGAMMRFVEDP
ncbi:nucleotidyltransferase domain-containing protein [Rhodocaloribacter litoris]|uniref:type VII toxin-antitoxin system MntA family adenylyltransferase antitoxin n=1 Tax=Rhodocaloribacter litoris TaxID=2558931 RepID=UPI001420ABFE|nr:nucleotidyltransferase domain-containing protein [Rhodocaloribacter litoris]QXD16446.1 nucleotidyltransferase domain-containing protein [Rhodocaloribacter litoris]